MDKVAVIIPTYNMPERTGAIVDHLLKHSSNHIEIIVVDNGSIPEYRYKPASVFLRDNVQTTNGWLAGLCHADALERKFNKSFDAYLIGITSTDIPEESGDVIGKMLEFMNKTYNAVACSPALTPDSTTSWEHMKVAGTGWRKTWMLDNIFTLYRAAWFNEIGRFDPDFVYAWGSDLETSRIARTEKKSMWICDDIQVRKVTDIGYTMDRMGMTSEDRRVLARKNMDDVMTDKYGSEWRKLMYNNGE
jgi:glycosyltransferase involved in cell wall biosynthesis